MAEPLFYDYSDKLCWSPRVCAVDDAWFEGGGGQAPLFDYLQLGGISEEENSLTKLLNKISERADLVSGDLRYLKEVARACQDNGLTLRLSNFEGLEEDWSKLNSKGNAILLDLNYTKFPDSAIKDYYGLHLIHRQIQGQRPYADVFVVSGGPSTFWAKLEEHHSEAEWWPIRTFPVVQKASAFLEDDLNSFALYFMQGNQQKPITELLRSLVRAVNEGWSHPDDFEKVPRDLPFRELYNSDIEAIKALFYGLQAQRNYADRDLDISILASLLSTSGFLVSSPPFGDSRVHLPWAPYGILWVASVWNLLHWLVKHRLPDQISSLTIEDNYAVLTIPLNPDPILLGDFSAAIYGDVRKGMAANAFVNLGAMEFPEILLEDLKSNESINEKEIVTCCLSEVAFKGGNNFSVDLKMDEQKILVRWLAIQS